ncbi:hypothetical protein B0T21DRAFT_367434 [Apiosordaria backusii]|uniref:Uncharacterized protein n=1 Tax=Apiosordaria backusii TaxID=314023 RepID=A0AA40BM28_9PEZI|nr:hypothetical protein B0T21DRAFT_367434 [Apiosordaria backusii]
MAISSYHQVMLTILRFALLAQAMDLYSLFFSISLFCVSIITTNASVAGTMLAAISARLYAAVTFDATIITPDAIIGLDGITIITNTASVGVIAIIDANTNLEAVTVLHVVTTLNTIGVLGNTGMLYAMIVSRTIVLDSNTIL